MIARLVVLGGCLLTLISAIGMVRFRDVYARMHAVTKASTVGVMLVLVGAALALTHPNDITSLALAAVLQVLTSPVAGNVVSLATYSVEGTAHAGLAVDELAERREDRHS